jgi:hypothetical protein
VTYYIGFPILVTRFSCGCRHLLTVTKEDALNLRTNDLLVLRLMAEKWRQDKKRGGFCRYGTWTVSAGQRSFVPDPFFDAWTQRLTAQGFSECVRTLARLALLELFDGFTEAFYEVTEKARLLLAGRLAA